MKRVRFVETDRGVRAVDDIEDRTFELHLPEAGAVRSISPEEFTFPVTAAIEIDAEQIVFPDYFGLFFYDRAEGTFVRTVEAATDDASISYGTYDADIAGTPLKIYLSFEGGVDIVHDSTGMLLDFTGTETIRIGARSLHSQPAGTITATDDIEDLMYAVSSFGSAMKTFSPERSFPTLRGHPPRLETGEELSTPTGIEPPDTGVEIAVPPEVKSVYTVASLAYYLGARIVPGTDPAVVAGDDRFPLVGTSAPKSARHLMNGAAAALERQFTLDCVVRTAGLYDSDLQEASRLQNRTDLDLERLYDLPLEERVAEYFDVPGHVVDDLLEWHSTTDVMPTVQYAEYLPFAVAELSHIRSYDPTDADSELVATAAESGDFFRSADDTPSPSAAGGASGSDGDTASAARSADSSRRLESAEVMTPPEADTDVHIWCADRYPVRAGKPTIGSLERRFDSENGTDDPDWIRILVVCNDPRMREESEDLYGFRDYFEFEIDVRYDLSTEELRDALHEEFDFFHYVGHVDEEGMRCHDGWLDLRDLEYTGVELFFLNACSSFPQGQALVEAGSRGGVITLSEVYNSLATRFGRRLARLLDAGFDLHGALAAGRDSVIGGGMYGIVGDGRAALCHNTDGVPTLHRIERAGLTEFEVIPISHPTLTYGIGSMMTFIYQKGELMSVVSGRGKSQLLSETALSEFLAGKAIPIEVNGTLYWSDEIQPSDI